VSKNKQKAELAEAKSTFVPSTGDASYLEPAGSKAPIAERKDWTAGMGALSLQELSVMANNINTEVEKAQKQAARSLVKIGAELLRARAVFRGDKEFGQWRKDNTYIQSQQTANRAMKIAERFESAPKFLKACSPSQLEELATAPSHVVEAFEKKIDQGEKLPGAHKIREEKIKPATDIGGSGTSKKAITAFMEKPDESTIEERVMATIAKPIEERIKVSNNPYDILGLYRFAPPNSEIINAIEEYYVENNDFGKDIAKAVAGAAHKVRREYNKS